MKQITVSDCTNEKLDALKEQHFGGDVETDTALFFTIRGFIR